MKNCYACHVQTAITQEKFTVKNLSSGKSHKMKLCAECYRQCVEHPEIEVALK